MRITGRLSPLDFAIDSGNTKKLSARAIALVKTTMLVALATSLSAPTSALRELECTLGETVVEPPYISHELPSSVQP